MNWGALMLKNPDPVEAPSGLLERTLGVLELLEANAHGLPLFEIADCLHIPRSATHRVLTSLIEQGYVKQEREQGAYQLTAKIASLAFTFLAGSGITDFAQPLIDRLARESGELVRLAMIDGRKWIWGRQRHRDRRPACVTTRTWGRWAGYRVRPAVMPGCRASRKTTRGRWSRSRATGCVAIMDRARRKAGRRC